MQSNLRIACAAALFLAGCFGNGEGQDWPAVLDRVGDATVNVYAEYPIAISWEEILLRGSALDMSTRRVVIVHAVLEFGSVFAAGAAIRFSFSRFNTKEEVDYTMEVLKRVLRLELVG